MRVTSGLEEDTLVVRVGDHGPGVLRAVRQQIFEPFKRGGQAVNEGSSGTGLGLAIARELAGRMDGSLNLVDSETGAIFELRVSAPPVLALVADDESSAA
jgi:signal transduction histidine kinase